MILDEHPLWNMGESGRNYHLCSLFIFLLVFQFPLSANDSDFDSNESTTSNTTFSLSSQERAKMWGLDTAEWTEYQRIMQGPRGNWTPNLDPLHVLGINAKTTAEQEKYAKKMAKMEYARLTREGEFAKAYHRHYKKLLGDEVMYPVNSSKKETIFQRTKYFLTVPCNRCKDVITKWINEGLSFDVYVVDSTDDAIKKFAFTAGISPLLVKSGQISLNHSTRDQAKTFGVTKFPQFIGGNE